MNESRFTGKLLKLIRAALPQAVVLKHCDMITKGIPDISITDFDGMGSATVVWIEVKLEDSPKKMFVPLQAAMLEKLGGYYVVKGSGKDEHFFFPAEEREVWHEEPLTFAALVKEIVGMF